VGVKDSEAKEKLGTMLITWLEKNNSKRIKNNKGSWHHEADMMIRKRSIEEY